MHNIISPYGNKTLKPTGHTFLITIIFINFYAWGADDAYPTLNRLALHKKIAKYEQLSQEQKNETLLDIVRKGGPDYSYPDRRVEIAALVHAGANVPAVQAKTPQLTRRLLPNIALMGDPELTQLLIDNKADINEQTFDKDTALHLAKTAKLAQLLLSKGALEHLSARQTEELITRLAWDGHAPELIPLYKMYDFNVLACDEAGYTVLMNLTIWPQQKSGIVKKAELLLEGLTIAQVKQYLAIKNHHNQTIFDIINKKTSEPFSASKQLYALRDFLEQRTDPEKYPDNPQAVAPKVDPLPKVAAVPECSVCLQPLDEQTCMTTPCNHIFHSYCLSVWANQNHSCPLCRAIV